MRNDAYASYELYSQISNNCIEYLIENDEDIWKLLYYMDNTPLNNQNLTRQQKANLVYDGSPDTTLFRVFLDRGQDDAMTDGQCVLKISPLTIMPTNRTSGRISVLFEVYCWYKNNHIKTDSYHTTRVDLIIQKIISLFNGSDIGGLGVMFMNKIQAYDNGTKQEGANPWKGTWIIMSNNAS